ncbi:hypothetical protein ACVWZ4_001136 [Bradyrhizobium sp. USDA 4472]
MQATFLLMAQCNGRAVIPVESVCSDFFTHLAPTKFIEKVRAGEIRLPLVRLESTHSASTEDRRSEA